eukprot:jgi/Undpi1/12286/HiC_scaffold_5.g01962.m1
MDNRWGGLGETGAGLDADRKLAESTRAKASEFEREREAYIEGAKQLVLRSPTSAAAAAAATPKKSSSSAAAEAEATAAAVVMAGAGGSVGRQHKHLGKVRAAPSLRRAREERRAASEEIRVLQQRKADAAVRLQGERLSNLEQGLELGVLRLERLLDRERILELLRLTDPNRPAKATGAASEEAEVSEELIDELEGRVEEAEERVRGEAAKLGAKMAGRLGDRAKREGGFRREAVEARDNVLGLQNALRIKEERLAQTVVDYLELRHAMLKVQQASSVAREDAAAERIVQEAEVRECRRKTAKQRKDVAEQVGRTCEEVSSELRRQIKLREDEACMLQEQRAEAEELYEARAVRLESLLEDWKTKYATLRRKFALETEGFRRDADNIGRRFERIRAGPPGGRPAISSRGGSSANHAVERAMYSTPNVSTAPGGRGRDRPAVEAAGVRMGARADVAKSRGRTGMGAAGTRRGATRVGTRRGARGRAGGKVTAGARGGGRAGVTAASEAAYTTSAFPGRRRGGV